MTLTCVGGAVAAAMGVPASVIFEGVHLIAFEPDPSA